MSDQSGVTLPSGAVPVDANGKPLTPLQTAEQTAVAGVAATVDAVIPVAGAVLQNSDGTIAAAKTVVDDAAAVANDKIVGAPVSADAHKFLADLETLGFDEVKDALEHLVSFKAILPGSVGLKGFFTAIGHSVGGLISKL